MREKYWKELDESKKIERMREVVKSLQGDVTYLRSVLESLERHQHLEGKIVIALHDGRPSGRSIGGRIPNLPDEVYF
jgi:hypothetical protein